MNKELRDIVDTASGETAESFASKLWSRIAEHIRKAKGASEPAIVESIPVITATGVSRQDRVFSYVEQETDDKVTKMRIGRYPAYKRVQMVRMYLTWLKAMGRLPAVLPAGAASIVDRLESLANPVSVDDVDSQMAWVCLVDSRIRMRNKECAEFLSSIPDSFVTELRGETAGMSRLRLFSSWRAEYAGVLQFLPQSLL